MPTARLVESALRVFNNQDLEVNAKEDKPPRNDGPPRDPVTLMSRPAFRRPCPPWREGLKTNQCANCMEEGHWKGECPKCLGRKLGGPLCPGPTSPVAHIKEEEN